MAKIKICGIKTAHDVQQMNLNRPDFCGFVFAPSLRQVTFEQAASLRKIMLSRIVTVGVFTDTPIEDIVKLYGDGVIKVAQLHGGQDEDFITKLKSECDIKIIQAIKVTKDCAVNISENADFVLFDSSKPGSGMQFDWEDLPEIDKPWFFAGGINMRNIRAALKRNPYGIDVASGAERVKNDTNTYPGKDPKQVAHLVEAVRKHSLSAVTP
jgi:phosphoribosylanthranilate isomerase